MYLLHFPQLVEFCLNDCLMLGMKKLELSKCFTRVTLNVNFETGILSWVRPCLFFKAALLDGKFTPYLET